MKTVKHLLFLLCLVVLSTAAQAQMLTPLLRGRVVRVQAPAAYTLVDVRRLTNDQGQLDSTGTLFRATTVTDSSGWYALNVPQGNPNFRTLYEIRTLDCDSTYRSVRAEVNPNGALAPVLYICTVPPNPCNIVFDLRVSVTGLSVNVQPIMIPTVAPRYVWNFGDGRIDSVGGGQHTYAAPGVYTVCVTATIGQCSETVCRTLAIGTAPNTSFYVGGRVFAGGRCVTNQVRVRFIPMDSAHRPRRNNPDTLCTYRTLVSPGRYIIRAIPTDPALIAAGYVPTLYGGVHRWDSASIVDLQQGRYDLDIQLRRRDTTRRLGRGQLRVRLNGHGTSVNTNMQTATAQLFDVEETPVFLYDNNNALVAFGMATATNADIDFMGLTAGTYRISPDAAFMMAVDQWSTLATDASSNNAAYTATAAGIVASVTAVAPRGTSAKLVAYPNPASTSFSLSVPKATGAAVVNLLAADGRTVFSKIVLDASATTYVSVEGLPAGMYHAVVSQNGAAIGTARVQVVQK